MSSLSVLVCSSCKLHDIHIPSHHLNLTSIQVLDLSFNDLEGPILCDFLKTMSHLQSLDLSFNDNIGHTIISCVSTISNLQHLVLRGTGLQGVIPSTIRNMTSMLTLDLSNNSLQGEIPSFLGNLCNMEKLDLSYNKYREKLSDAFQSLSGCLSNSLTSLDMSSNLFFGKIPDQIADFKNLTTVSLHNNSLSGHIPVSLGSLSNLQTLSIYSNHLQGVVSEFHFANLTKLERLDAYGNSLNLSVTSNWIPPFDLVHLDLSDWNLGHQIPLWLKSQKIIYSVGLSNTSISGVIPSWFWNFSSQLAIVQLSNNHLRDVISDLSSISWLVDLASNELTGPLPRISSSLQWLDLSNNFFTGEISGLLCGNGSGLEILHLGDNHLEGNIPNCWEHWPSLGVIDFQSNYLTGQIPSSMGILDGLQSLNLGNNRLTGEIPNSLRNCSYLRALNLGRNKLVGTIPKWIGSLPELSVLILRSNKMNGEIPIELCALDKLRILDVSGNNLYGSIPRCFKNAFAATPTDESGSMVFLFINKEVAIENAFLVTKGKENQYGSILGLVISIDLSRNNLSGEIPEEFASLQGLRFLNLSGNHLFGGIPNKIGNMTALESLDLSWNNLSGPIPSTMSYLTFLNFLNLSHNNFSGEIPKSTQLQSLSSTSFAGNQLLCGDPLPKRCREDGSQVPLNEDEGEGYWFRLGVGVGFGVGFLGIIAPLALSGIWRRAYFWFFQEYIWYNILDCIIKIKYDI